MSWVLSRGKEGGGRGYLAGEGVELSVGVAGPESVCPLLLHHLDTLQLVAEREPVGLAVVHATKQLDLESSWRETLNDAVHLRV